VLIDCQSPDYRAEAKTIVRELTHYSPAVAQKPMCFVLTKLDLLAAAERRRTPKGWLAMSAVSGKGVERVLSALDRMLAKTDAVGTS
jgi:GTPase involved in cell partitioning and DNA repair